MSWSVKTVEWSEYTDREISAHPSCLSAGFSVRIRNSAKSSWLSESWFVHALKKPVFFFPPHSLTPLSLSRPASGPYVSLGTGVRFLFFFSTEQHLSYVLKNGRTYSKTVVHTQNTVVRT